MQESLYSWATSYSVSRQFLPEIAEVLGLTLHLPFCTNLSKWPDIGHLLILRHIYMCHQSSDIAWLVWPVPAITLHPYTHTHFQPQVFAFQEVSGWLRLPLLLHKFCVFQETEVIGASGKVSIWRTWYFISKQVRKCGLPWSNLCN